jgi:integrase
LSSLIATGAGVASAELAQVVAFPSPGEADRALARLRRVLDVPRLIEAGYDPATGVIRPPADHPVLGHELCPVAGCMSALLGGRLCFGCRQRFRRFDGTFEEFVAIPRLFGLSRRAEQRLCLVCRTPGHERPAVGPSGLCLSCDSCRRARGLTVYEYVPGAVPRVSFGRCVRCDRWAAYERLRLCTACRNHWALLGKPDLEGFAALPLRRSRAASRGIEVDLSGLGERVRLEILYAFEQTWLDGGYAWEGTRRLQSLADALARAGAGSLLDGVSISARMVEVLYRRLRGPVERLFADPERELERDVWRLRMLRPDGGGQTVDYSAISQGWLRDLVKTWNRQRLVSHSVGLLRLDVSVAAELSGVLGLRADGGADPRSLGRGDVVDFVVHLRARQLRGEITAVFQRNCVTRARAMLRDARERGRHREAGPLCGLADGFAFIDADVPRKVRRDVEGEPGRALPQLVIDRLLSADAIGLLHQVAGEAVGCALELQMRTGRRPQEIAHAPFDCLDHEQRVREDATVQSLPVFVYRPEKRPMTRKELPIFAEERRLIRRMQALARERFPATDSARLPLLPCQMRNRDGRKPIAAGMLAWKMRDWVARLDELTGPDGEPFDRRRVFPYAFRHSYAQRLADEGASESELMDLMDHDSFETTRGYFRIRAERRRRAAELGRAALFDNQGRRLLRGLERLAEAERARMEIGSLAVPYGACVEPANVASMGGACKFMLKCLGCKHFRTDLSHLPALEAYERQLIAAREQLSAQADAAALENWARTAATPSQEEIDRVRYLIERIRETIGELPSDERAELQALLAAERTNRSAILARLPARAELNVLNVTAAFDGAPG